MEEAPKSPLPPSIVDVFEFLNSRKEEVHKSIILGLRYANETDNIWIWRGFGRDIAKHVHYNINVIYRTLSLLDTLGSIKLLKHGAGPAPSVYQIIREPQGKEYIEMKERSLISDRLQVPTQAAKIQDTLNRINNRLNQLEARMKIMESKVD